MSLFVRGDEGGDADEEGSCEPKGVIESYCLLWKVRYLVSLSLCLHLQLSLPTFVSSFVFLSPSVSIFRSLCLSLSLSLCLSLSLSVSISLSLSVSVSLCLCLSLSVSLCLSLSVSLSVSASRVSPWLSPILLSIVFIACPSDEGLSLPAALVN